MLAPIWAWCLGLIPLAVYAWGIAGILRLELQIGTNNSEFARRTFIELLRDAKDSMLICDDGNDMSASIYNSEEVICAVRERLEAAPDLQLLCLFSSDDDTQFTTEFANNRQVHMIRGAEPRRDIHFKIIDSGRRGYVSAHPYGAEERQYRLYDCSRVPGFVRNSAFGRHILTMREAFSSQGVSVA